jgi:hypothetical protein
VRSTSASKAAITAVRASADSKVLMTISRGWLDYGSILARTSATLPESTPIAQWSLYYVSGYETSTTTHSQTQLMQTEPYRSYFVHNPAGLAGGDDLRDRDSATWV